MDDLVLVADQDPFELRLLQELCEEAGHRVLTAATGNDVLDAIGRQRPDVLLVDSRLPGLDGFELLRILKADPVLAPIPVLLVLRDGDLDGRSRGLELGANDYVSKPYRIFEVHRRVQTAIKTAREALRRSMPPDPFDSETGAGTAAQLSAALDYELIRTERYGHSLGCVVVVAEDGDPRTIAEGLRTCIRLSDQLFREAQRTFVMLLPETDPDGAKVVISRVKSRIEAGQLGSARVRVGHVTVPKTKIAKGSELLRAARPK
jgi:PleD family two-component response regulator